MLFLATVLRKVSCQAVQNFFGKMNSFQVVKKPVWEEKNSLDLSINMKTF